MWYQLFCFLRCKKVYNTKIWKGDNPFPADPYRTSPSKTAISPDYTGGLAANLEKSQVWHFFKEQKLVLLTPEKKGRGPNFEENGEGVKI